MKLLVKRFFIKLTFPFQDCSAHNAMKIYNDADFYAGDIGKHGDVSTTADCVDLCVSDAKCFFFTYNSKTLFCYLKDWISIKLSQHRIKILLK